MTRTSSPVFVLLILALVASPTFAADTLDLSSPKQAGIAFAKAVERGDLDAVKASSVGTEDDYKLVQLIMGLIDANKQLREASIAKFGEEGKQISTDDLSDLSKQVESGEVKVTGETATVGKADEKDPMKLKRMDGGWKVDLASIPDKQQMAKSMPKMQEVMARAASDIKAGKYKTVEEAKQAVGQQIFAVVAEQLNVPQSQPAPGQSEPSK